MPKTPENHADCERPSVPASSPRLRLSAAGPAGRVQCETSQPVTLIGSRRDCQLPLNDPNVSKVHCAVVHTGRALVVCDLCSRSGTFLNGRPIRVSALASGDHLRVGAIEIAIESLKPASDPATTATKPGIPLCPTGPLVITVGGREVDLSAGAAVVGRRSTCDLIIDTPDVSLSHALFFACDGRPAICDLGSRSGTFVNDERIQLAWIHAGDQLTIGGVTLPLAGNVPARVPGVADSLQVAEAAVGELSADHSDEDERAARLDRREAELEALAALLGSQFEHIDRLKDEVARRAEEVEQAVTGARERLALALSHEHAVTAAWEELDRWHAQREARFKAHQEKLANFRRLPALAGELEGFAVAAPLARPAGCPDSAGSGTVTVSVSNA
jgi:pSer/pThr/pTyr-binding forkhead associated (FHA) protein